MSERRVISAATVSSPGGEFEIAEVEIDQPSGNEVLVRIEAVGMCHADLAARDGDFPFPLPGVLGHEGVGVVEQIGPLVHRVATGDRVVLTFDSCGDCDRCLRGRPSQCLRFVERNFSAGGRPDGGASLWRDGSPIHGNFFGQSSFATHALANERNAIAVNVDVRPELLAPLGCGVQTGAGAVLNVLRPEPGSSLAIFGAGAVGLSAVMAAGLVESCEVIVVDVHELRLDLARSLGARHVINARTTDPVAAIGDLTAGGAGNALECSGVPAVFRQAAESIATGGTLGVLGAPSFGQTAAVDIAALVNASRRIVGIVEGASNPAVFLPRLADLVAAGKLPVERLVEVFTLAEINSAAAATQDGTVIKPVFMPEAE